MPRFAYGGQGLMEGVLMRGRDAIAVAIRHPDGGTVTATEPLPLFRAQAATPAIGQAEAFVEHLVEGLIRVAIFVAYLLLVSQAGDIKRVFRYHGAEDMTIHALEHDPALTIDNIRRHPTAHP